MPSFKPLAAARSRVLRGSSVPKTPEPVAEGELQPPSPPRPRFRLRKRNPSQVNASAGPTEQFLASVASADIPIPSIEEPRVIDEDMVDAIYPTLPHFGDATDMGFSHHSDFGRSFSPPKTPAPLTLLSLSPTEFPDWSMSSMERGLESSPEAEISRPSTARSTQTESSLFSHLSFNSQATSQNVSPKFEHPDTFGPQLSVEDCERTIRPPRSLASIAKSRKPKWTKTMSQHLWYTYTLYLQDPKVTPFRASKSGIPPEGVCIRVTRVAMRTWRGPKAPPSQDDSRSGSTTPTKDDHGRCLAWPHTRAATRAHLRELCKSSSGGAHRRSYIPHQSPTPFGRTVRRSRARFSTPVRSPSVFAPGEMAMSLAISTSDSMQPAGPLAELTRSEPTSMQEQMPLPAQSMPDPFAESAPINRSRLGSPFVAKSYGPSSSSALANLELGGLDRRSQTLGARRGLRSPAPVTRTQPNSAKRRVRTAMLESRRAKRPSLATDLWDEPQLGSERVDFSSTSSSQRDNLFVPRTNLQELFESTQPAVSEAEKSSDQAIPAISISDEAPQRLGSPFAVSSSSLSVPNRLSRGPEFRSGAARKPFATLQESIATENTPRRSSLASRLAYIDERLKDFRRRDQSDRRSRSPMN